MNAGGFRGRDMKVKPWKDVNGFYAEFYKESPRAQAIIDPTFLDEWLRELLSNFFVDDANIVDQFLDRQLQKFSSRIDAAYCLGLISAREHHDLRLIRDIRNEFAHSLHDMIFKRQEIKSRCNNLHIPKDLNPSLTETPNTRFTLTIGLILFSLIQRVDWVKKVRRSLAQEFYLELRDEPGENSYLHL